jgi:uncharacterized protein YybS (DUF2232 family)
MKRPIVIAMAAGALGAALLVAAAQGSVFGMAFGVLLSPLPLAMAVLGLGAVYFPAAVVAGAVAATVLSGTFAFAVVYVLLDAVPVAMLTRMAARGDRGSDGPAVGRSVAVLALVAMGLMVLALAAIPLVGEGGVESTVRARLGEVFAAAAEAGRIAIDGQPGLIDAMASFLPGAAGWDWCLRGVISAAMAQAVLTRMGEAQSPTPPYRGVAMPSWYIAVFWATAATAWLAPGDVKYVAMNAAAILCLSLLMQGLAVVHSGLARVDHRTMWLVAFYVLALMMAALAIVVLVTLGVVEHFLKLRARMMPPPQGG